MRNNSTLLFFCFALAVVASAESNRRWSEDGLQIRGILDPPDTSLPDTTTTPPADTTTSTTDTPTTTQETTTTPDTTTTTPTTTDTPTTTKPTDPGTTTTTPTTTPTTAKTDTTTSPTTKNTDATVTTPTTTLQPSTTHVVTTDGNGDNVTIYTTFTPTPTPASSSASPSATDDSSNSSSDDKDSGISTGSIIGMSVAGGVALIGFACFIFWKFTRKRASDFDDNEAIKWPELNSHTEAGDSQPLPAGAGRFDDGSNLSLSRQNSGGTTGGRSYGGGASNYSTADLGPDPYGVPPLPHLNPNQNMPYRDDPSGAAYYDPYRGPVPQFGPIPGEAIPMGQMQYSDMAYGDPRVASPMRTGSPAPLGAPQAYGLGASDQIARTGSPMRMASPGPGSAYGPGPQAAYDPVTFHGGR